MQWSVGLIRGPRHTNGPKPTERALRSRTSEKPRPRCRGHTEANSGRDGRMCAPRTRLNGAGLCVPWPHRGSREEALRPPYGQHPGPGAHDPPLRLTRKRTLGACGYEEDAPEAARENAVVLPISTGLALHPKSCCCGGGGKLSQVRQAGRRSVPAPPRGTALDGAALREPRDRALAGPGLA